MAQRNSTAKTVSLILAVIIVISMFSAWIWASYLVYKGEHTNQRESISSYSAQTADEYADRCTKENATIMAVLNCAIGAIDANREAQRSSYDLQAQQERAVRHFAGSDSKISPVFRERIDVIIPRSLMRLRTNSANFSSH